MARFASLVSLFTLCALSTAPAAEPDAKPQPAKSPVPGATGGNRLAYLDEINPYYPHKDFAKLITPQWVGEEGVEAVVILSIDDMRDPARYEKHLRPILDRLKKVENSDGLSRMSIFTNSVNPADPVLQTLIKEGVSLEVHTITHPCPCLGTGNAIVGAKPGSIEAAKATYDGCVDLLHQIPNYKGPVAFRMPCCDSMNSVSPRFFAEVMNKTTSKGHFLSIDSSVFNVFTSDDPALPRELVLEKDPKEGAAPDAKRERFAKYAQFPGFVNTIENYPYPYVIGNTIWQFPCVVPSDWEAQHLQKPNNPKTVEDLKANLDCTVIKQGVFTLVFHPHGWIKAEQIVELIDHAEKKHGKKVKFLNFQDALERINKNMLAGQAIRSDKGGENGIRILDLNGDKSVDVLIANDRAQTTRTWNAKPAEWRSCETPFRLVTSGSGANAQPAGFAFGIINEKGDASIFLHRGKARRYLAFDSTWKKRAFNEHRYSDDEWAEGGVPVNTGAVFRDLLETDDEGFDGYDDFILIGLGHVEASDGQWHGSDPLLCPFPNGPTKGSATCFIDIDRDGDLDMFYSDADSAGLFRFESIRKGWPTRVFWEKRSESRFAEQIPPIIRADGTNNGFFVKGDALYWQNEDTGGKEPHHVKKITFKEVLALGETGRVGPTNDKSAPNPEKPSPNDKENKDNKDTGQGTGPARPGSLNTYEGKNFTTAHPAPPPARTIEESLRSIQVREGFRVELVASEPLTMDPIAFDWGPDGKLWIVEMADYPMGIGGDFGPPAKMGKPGGRIVYLEDTNGDEKYDKRTIFLDGVPFPTGVMVWKKGVLVTAAPDIFYAEDTDNDGKADKRETLFTGFGEGNQQHRVNGLRWGLDGWIYLGNGDSGGMIRNLTEAPPGRARADGPSKNGDAPNSQAGPAHALPGGASAKGGAAAAAAPSAVNVSGRDLRIREIAPGKWQLDPQSGQTQFGRERDDFGNWFGNNNPNPGWHYALEDHYLRRNPHVAAPNPRVDLTGDRTIYPISIVHSPSIENHRITPGQPAQHSSANSLCPYRDDLYGPDFATSIFISEPVHNLVRRLVLKPQGVTFRAERPPGEEKKEFLASSDPWFRPTMLRTGPDGCLWIADMHRQTIEHPQWIPPAWQKAVNLREGDDKGRIYRVVPVDKKPRAMLKMPEIRLDGEAWPNAALENRSAVGLVATLNSPNGWLRDMAQMMLAWGVTESDEIGYLNLFAARNEKAKLEPNSVMYKKVVEHLEQAERSTPELRLMESLALNAPNERVRIQALSSLETRRCLSRPVLLQALGDSHAAVRRAALRLCERDLQSQVSLPGKSSSHTPNAGTNTEVQAIRGMTIDKFVKDFGDAIGKLVQDTDPAVRQQLAYTLGEWHDERAGKALAQILIKDASDPYIVAAAMSSVLPHLDTVLKELIGPTGAIPQDQIAARAPIIEKLIGMAVAADQLGAVTSMLDVVTMPQDGKYGPWQFSALSRLLDAMARKNLTLAKLRENAGAGGDKTEPTVAARKKLAMTLDRIPQVTVVARSVAVDPKESEDLRLAAIELFSRLGGEQRLQIFTVALTDLRSPPAVQQAAAGALAKLGGSAAHQALLAGWSGYSPALRSAVIDGLLKQDDAALALLNAIEKKSPGAPGAVSPHDVDVPRRQPLLNHKDEAIRAKASFVFGGQPDADRQKVIDAYTAELAKLGRGGANVDGDATRGKAAFEKNCAACHRLGDVGRAGIAPDLAKVADASQQGMLISILDPNRAVEAKYISYLAETKGGDHYTGILLTETGSSITIVGVDGKERTILRSELESLRSTGLSLMPNGLEQAMKPADMADLFAFIASHGPPPKRFPGNEPRKITADDKGVLTLPASAAEVRGPTLIFEQQYKNLGYWSSEQDHATWTIEIADLEKPRADDKPRPEGRGPNEPVDAAGPRPAGRGLGTRKYDVTLDWALANESKSHAFQLLIAGQRVTGPVDSTGSWDAYKQAKVGTISLPAGTHRVVFRSVGAVSGALIDLRTVTLTPVK